MKEHLRLGRIAGVAVGVNASVLVIFALVVAGLAGSALPTAVEGRPTGQYWATAVVVGLLFFGSLLAHELAHAVVAQHHGVRVEGITLWMLGGVAQLLGEPRTPRDDLRIAAAGPLTSFAAGAVFAVAAALCSLLSGPDLLTAGLAWLAGINVLLAVFNLLPGAPLDGGRVLRAFLWRRYQDRTRAALAADRAGRGLGFGMVWLGVMEVLLTSNPVGGLWLALLGWFLVAAAGGEAAATSQHALLADLPVRAAMTPHPVTLPSWRLVESVLDRVVAEPHTSYPVVSFEGRPLGLVTAARIAQLPPSARAQRRVGELVVRLSEVAVAGPDEPLADALDRVGGRLPLLVLDGADLVGIVTTRDVHRLLLRGTLAPAGG